MQSRFSRVKCLGNGELSGNEKVVHHATLRCENRIPLFFGDDIPRKGGNVVCRTTTATNIVNSCKGVVCLMNIL